MDSNFKIALKIMTRRFKKKLVYKGSGHCCFAGVNFQSDGFFPSKDPARIYWYLKRGEWTSPKYKFVQLCRSKKCISHVRIQTERERLKLPIYISGHRVTKNIKPRLKGFKFGSKADKIIAEWNENINMAELARSYGVSRQYVNKVVKQHEMGISKDRQLDGNDRGPVAEGGKPDMGDENGGIT